jgi:hypothetical protein
VPRERRSYSEPPKKKEQYVPLGPVESIKINGKEIHLGQDVPILQHEICSGSMGTVKEILGQDIKVECNTCRKSGMMVDMVHLV